MNARQPLSQREALIVRELTRTQGYVTVAELADAIGYGPDAWELYIPRKTSLSPIAHARVRSHIQQIRRKWGPIIEADNRAGPGKHGMGYRLTDAGRELL